MQIAGAVGAAVIVLDVSPSMRASRAGIANGLTILERQLAELPADGLFNLVCFAETARSLSEKPLAVTAENKSAALAFVSKCAAHPLGDGGTDGTSRLDLGIAHALRQKPGRIVVISDGAPIVRHNGHSLTQPELLGRIRSLLPEHGTRPALHSIPSGPQQSPFLQKLAKEFSDSQETEAVAISQVPQ